MTCSCTTKMIIQAEKAPKPIGPYSAGVLLGQLIFTAGQLGIDPQTGNLVPGGIQAETRQALANLKAILEEGGSEMGQVLKTTVFMKDMNEFSLMNAIYAEFFGEYPPARSTVQVAALPKDGAVEIEAIASSGLCCCDCTDDLEWCDESCTCKCHEGGECTDPDCQCPCHDEECDESCTCKCHEGSECTDPDCKCHCHEHVCHCKCHEGGECADPDCKCHCHEHEDGEGCTCKCHEGGECADPDCKCHCHEHEGGEGHKHHHHEHEHEDGEGHKHHHPKKD